MIQQKEHQQKQEENKCIYEKVIHDNRMNDQQRLDRLQQLEHEFKTLNNEFVRLPITTGSYGREQR